MTTVISVENLSKTYRLGQISTGTFTYDPAVWWAKIRGRPNPMTPVVESFRVAFLGAGTVDTGHLPYCIIFMLG